MCVHACASVCPDMNFILCVSCMCVHVYPVCAHECASHVHVCLACAYTWMCIFGYLCVCAGVCVSCMCVYAWMSIWSACVSWKCVHMCVLHVRMLECASCESVIMKEEASVPTKLVSSLGSLQHTQQTFPLVAEGAQRTGPSLGCFHSRVSSSC